MTIDEELTRLEDDLRRLKIEWEVYFNGYSERPPRDRVFRVETVIKRYGGDQSKLNFSQRFKMSALTQKYAVQNALWKRKLMEKEEGRGYFRGRNSGPAEWTAGKKFYLTCSDPENEPEKVEQIFNALVGAQRQVGQTAENIDPVRFRRYLCEKTRQIKDSLGCRRVQFSVSVEAGQVKFTAGKA